jgi:transposase
VEFIGLDVHRHYSVYTRLDEGGRILGQGKVANEAVAGIVSGLGGPCKVVLEATGNWGYIADELQPVVDEIVLAHPLQVKAIAAAKVKTDKVDATILAHLLRTDLIPRSYLAPPHVREMRDLLRLRASLVRLRTTVKNKIHAILAKRGLSVPVTDLFGKKGRLWLAQQELSPVQGKAVSAYLALIDLLEERMALVSAEIDRQAEEREEVQLLMTIPGIGRYSALLIISEVGDIRRFPDGDRLAAYAGLVPGVRASGGKARLGPITKQGSAWLRWILVEAVYRAARRPGCLRDRYERLRRRKGSPVAAVATARFLATCIHAVLTERRPFRNSPSGSPFDMTQKGSRA